MFQDSCFETYAVTLAQFNSKHFAYSHIRCQLNFSLCTVLFSSASSLKPMWFARPQLPNMCLLWHVIGSQTIYPQIMFCFSWRCRQHCLNGATGAVVDINCPRVTPELLFLLVVFIQCSWSKSKWGKITHDTAFCTFLFNDLVLPTESWLPSANWCSVCGAIRPSSRTCCWGWPRWMSVTRWSLMTWKVSSSCLHTCTCCCMLHTYWYKRSWF